MISDNGSENAADVMKRNPPLSHFPRLHAFISHQASCEEGIEAPALSIKHVDNYEFFGAK